MSVKVELAINSLDNVRVFSNANKWTFDYDSDHFIVLDDNGKALGEYPERNVLGIRLA